MISMGLPGDGTIGSAKQHLIKFCAITYEYLIVHHTLTILVMETVLHRFTYK